MFTEVTELRVRIRHNCAVFDCAEETFHIFRELRYIIGIECDDASSQLILYLIQRICIL